MLIAVSVARMRCEMRRGEGEDGSEDLSSDEDHAITAVMGALLFTEKEGNRKTEVLSS